MKILSPRRMTEKQKLQHARERLIHAYRVLRRFRNDPLKARLAYEEVKDARAALDKLTGFDAFLESLRAAIKGAMS